MIADLVLFNGNIHTMDGDSPVVSAVAVRGNTILAVGDDETMKGLLTADGDAIDLNGATVTPGLVDAHVHFRWFAMSLQQVNVYEVPSLAEALDRVAAKVVQKPEGEWITGRGWKNELWENPAFPTAADLDRVAPNHPVYMSDKSGHAGWANSLALKLAGIDDGTADPDGGEIQRDSDGKATGILFETAMKLVSNCVPKSTHAQIVAAMREAQEACWEVGLTGIHDFDGATCFSCLQQLEANGELGLRFYKNIPEFLIDQAVATGLRTDFGSEWLRIGGVKIFADGALGAQTALMIEPYETNPENYGIAVKDKEEMHAIASKAAANGLSVTVHAIGDKAVHDILDVYEAVRGEEAARGDHRSLRHRIEHVQIFHPDDKDRLAELDIVASMQPKHATSDMEMADKFWGARAKYSYAWRSMADSGALLVFGSDCPVEPIDPMLGIYAAVTRKRPIDDAYAPDGWYKEEAVTMEETIRAFTLAAAEVSGQTDRLGSITAGKFADFTIFDRDLWTVTADELAETKVIGTIVGGEIKYRKGF